MRDFCWTDINTTFLKYRLKLKTINDVKSMSLYSLMDNILTFFIVYLINSCFTSFYVNDFINNTQTFQINNARQLPIIIPTDDQLKSFKELFNNALSTKKQQFNNLISERELEIQLSEIQKALDKMVNALYTI